MAAIVNPDDLGGMALQLAQFGIVTDIFNGKLILHCGKHHYYYNARTMPTPGCKACHMTQHVGLLMAVPKERQDEILEDLEYSVNHLVEAAKRGQIDLQALNQAVHVKIDSEDGTSKVLS